MPSVSRFTKTTDKLGYIIQTCAKAEKVPVCDSKIQKETNSLESIILLFKFHGIMKRTLI